MCGKTKTLTSVFLLAVGILGTVFAALFMPSTATAAAGINQQLNFTGKVVNTNGTNIADGTYNMEFKIYQDGTNTGSGSTLKWTEDELISASHGVVVSGGTFQVNLGAVTSLSSVDFNQDTLWLSMQVGSGTTCTVTTGFTANCSGDGEMSPYIRLTAVPYAFNALKVGGLSASQLVQLSPGSAQSGNISLSSGNNVAVGALQSNSLDAFASGTLTLGGTNTTAISVVDSTTITSGHTLTVQGGNAVTLGSTTAAGGIVFQDGTVNNRTITVSSPALTNSYSLSYPTSGATGNTCLQSTSGSTSTVTALQFGSCSGSPSGSAGGDLGGTYPNPTVAKINGVGLGSTTATSGNLLVGSGTQWVSQALSGDATFNSSGVLTLGTGSVNSAKIADGTIANVDLSTGTFSNITGTGALAAGSIASGFGTIATGNTITGTTINGTTGINTGSGAGTQRIDNSGNLVNIGTIAASGNITTSGGNIGVGTASPGANLDVQSSATTGTALNVTANSLTSGSAINVTSATTGSTTGSVVTLAQNGTLTSSELVASSILNVGRSLTTNIASGAPAITFDSTVGYVSPTSWSHTVASRTNRLLVVDCEGGTATPTSITFNGVAMTRASAYYASPGGISIWTLISPAIGTHTVNIVGGDCDKGVSTSWYNVDQTTGIGTSVASSGGPPTSGTITSAIGQVITDAMVSGGTSNTPGSGQTVLYNNTWGSNSYKAAGAGSTTMSWTASAGGGKIVLVNILPLGAPSVSVTGPVAQLSSNCTVTAGGCTDTSNILSLNQQYASATGAVAVIQNAGTGDAIQIQNGGGTVLANFDNAGRLFTPGLDTPTNTGLSIGSANATSLSFGSNAGNYNYYYYAGSGAVINEFTTNLANTINIGNVNSGTSISLTGNTSVKSITGNSTTAFQIQNASGAQLFAADTTNGNIEVIGSLDTPSGGFGQYQNLLTYSEDMDNAAWTKSNLTVAANNATAPDGLTTADTDTISTASNQSLYQTVTVSPSTSYTFSWWAKRGTASSVKYGIYDATHSSNIVSPTVYGATTAGWQRFTATFTTPSGTTSIRVLPLYNGAATGTAYVWGAQLEQASTAGVYTHTGSVTSATASTGLVVNGTSQVNNQVAGNVAMVIQGAASQTADLLQFQDSSGSVMSKFTAGGNLVTYGSVYLGSYTGSGGLNVNTTGPSQVGVVIQGSASQTADLLDFKDSGGTVVAHVSQYGDFYGGYIQGTSIYASATNTTTTELQLQGVSSQTAALAIFKAGTSQTGDLLQLQDISGNVLTNIDATGNLHFAKAASTSTLVLNARVSGDSNDRFTIGADGKLSWGTGSATPSVTLSRNSNNFLVSSGGIYGVRLAVGSAGTGGTAAITAQANNPGDVGAIVQGAASQTADLLQFQDSSGTTLAKIDSSGNLNAQNVYANAGVTSIQGNAYISSLYAQSSASSVAPVAVFKSGTTPTSTADFLQLQNSSGTVLANVNNTGTFSIQPGSSYNLDTSGNSYITEQTNGTVRFANLLSGKGVQVQADSFAFQDTTGWGNDFTIDNTGSVTITNRVNSTAALQVNNASYNPVFNVDTYNNNIQIGSTTTDSTAVLLTVDSYNAVLDPTGYNGSIYYNTARGTFRCYEGGSWEDCVSGLLNHDGWSVRVGGGTTNGTAFNAVGLQITTTGSTFAGSNGPDAAYETVTTGTTAAASAGFASAVRNTIRRTYNPTCTALIRTPGTLTAGERIYFGLTTNSTFGNADDPGGSVIAMRYSNVSGDTGTGAGWRAVTRDGTSLTIGSSNIGGTSNVATSTIYLLKFRVDDASGTVYMSVNGSAESAVTATLPSTSANLGAALQIVTSDTTSDSLLINRMACEQS